MFERFCRKRKIQRPDDPCLRLLQRGSWSRWTFAVEQILQSIKGACMHYVFACCGCLAQAFLEHSCAQLMIDQSSTMA